MWVCWYLSRQKGIGDRRTGAADHVEDAAAHLRGHRIGRGEPADADHRLCGQRLDEGDVGFLVTLGLELRRGRILREIADVDVPHVGKLAQHLDNLAALGAGRDAVVPDHLVDREPDDDPAAIAHRVLGFLDQLAQQPGAVFEAAAVFVGPLIAPPRQKVLREGEVVRGVDVDEVDIRASRPQRRLAVPPAKRADVRLVHGSRLDRIVVLVDVIAGRDRILAGKQVGNGLAVVHELDAGQRAVAVHTLNEQGQKLDIAVVP